MRPFLLAALILLASVPFVAAEDAPPAPSVVRIHEENSSDSSLVPSSTVGVHGIGCVETKPPRIHIFDVEDPCGGGGSLVCRADLVCRVLGLGMGSLPDEGGSGWSA